MKFIEYKLIMLVVRKGADKTLSFFWKQFFSLSNSRFFSKFHRRYRHFYISSIEMRPKNNVENFQKFNINLRLATELTTNTNAKAAVVCSRRKTNWKSTNWPIIQTVTIKITPKFVSKINFDFFRKVYLTL